MPLIPRRLKLAALILGALILVYGLAGWFGIPAAVRWALAGPVSQELGRTVSVKEVRANPFTLHVELQGLEVAPAADETTPPLRVENLVVDASWTSLPQRAAVIDHLDVRGLAVHLVRLAEQRFNVSDIIERILARPSSPDTTHFAVYNIQLHDGSVVFDDRVRGVTDTVSAIEIGVPFVSNFPSDRDVQVQPLLAARVNGQPLEIKGETLPFEASLATVLKLKFEDFDLPHLAGFSPVPLNFLVQQGKLGGDVSLTYRRATPATKEAAATPARMIFAGQMNVADFALAAPAGREPQPLLVFKRLEVGIEELGLLLHRAHVRSVKLEAPRITLTRSASGLNWTDFAARPLLATKPDRAKPAAPAPQAKPAKPAEAPKPWTWQLDELLVTDGTLDFTDRVVGGKPRRAEAIRVEVRQLASDSATPASVAASLATPEKESLSIEGKVALAPLAADLLVKAGDIQLASAAPYLKPFLRGSLEGRSSASARVSVAAPAEGKTDPEIRVTELASSTEALRLRGPTDSGATLDLKAARLEGGSVNLGERSVELGRIAIEAPRTSVTRLADGRIGWSELLVPQAAAPTQSAPWTVRVGEFDLSAGEVRFEDQSTQPAARLRVGGVQVNVKKLAPGTAQRSDVRLRAFMGRGWVSAGGWVSLEPLATWMWIDARNLNLAPLRPYFSQHINAVLASAEASARGNLELVLPADAPPRYSYSGNASIGNAQVLESDAQTPLLNWKLLAADKIALRSPGAKGSPLSLSIGAVTADDFYARVILSAAGKLNLAEVLKAPAPAADAGKPAAAAPAAAAPPAQPAPPAEAAPRPDIQIGGIKLTRGAINFTDNFIKPNYTANVTGLSGTISALSSDDAAVPAQVDLNGKLDGEAPVTLAGTVNPLTRQLSLDLRGDAEGIDLPSFTPYSVKYAGYPITKGKLSLRVSYKVADGQLSANNQITLDQLTFGPREDSPDATKLPVLLAVSLLKDSAGNINIDLPISGSLNDPQFSVGGLIFRAIVNLLTRAVTSPFTLLASAFGGGGEELGYIAFAPGTSSLAEDQITKLKTLARALADRPSLKLDITGRVDPALDVPGLKEARLLAKLRAVHVKQLVAAGEEVDPATVTISPAQRPALMATVYGDESIPDKPRNLLGFAKSIPMAEQEKLILANMKVSPEDLRALANRRAEAVRAWMVAEGQIARDRVFVVEPKLNAEGIKEGAPTSRVDFSLQ